MSTANKAFNAALSRVKAYDDYCKEVVANCSTPCTGIRRPCGITFNLTFMPTTAGIINTEFSEDELNSIGKRLCEEHFSHFFDPDMNDDDTPEDEFFCLHVHNYNKKKQLVSIMFGRPRACGIVDVKNIDY